MLSSSSIRKGGKRTHPPETATVTPLEISSSTTATTRIKTYYVRPGTNMPYQDIMVSTMTLDEDRSRSLYMFDVSVNRWNGKMPKWTKPGAWPYDEAINEIRGRIVVHRYLVLPGQGLLLDHFYFCTIFSFPFLRLYSTLSLHGGCSYLNCP